MIDDYMVPRWFSVPMEISVPMWVSVPREGLVPRWVSVPREGLVPKWGSSELLNDIYVLEIGDLWLNGGFS